MKKSRLKYIYIALLLLSIFGLYQWNKKFFESTDTLGRKMSPAVISNSFSTGEGSDMNGGFGGGFSSGEAGNYSDNANPTSSNNNFTAAGFHSSGFTTKSSNNTSHAESEQIEHIVPDIASNSSGGGGSSSTASSGGGISLGIPLLSTEKKEEDKEKDKKEVATTINTNRTAAQDRFFSGNIEAPMAPLPPNEDVPLDGGASIILVLGSMIGLKKLLPNRKLNS